MNESLEAIRKKSIGDNPYALNLFFTGKCNLNCHYCFVNKVGLANATLDEDSLKKSIGILFRYPGKKKTISFNGGEPTLEWPLVKKIYEHAKRQAKKKGIILDVAVMTNGTLLNQEMFDYFVRNKTIVKISIDGDKLIHDKNRPFKKNPQNSSFDKIIQNIQGLKTRNLRLAAAMVFTPRDIDRFLSNIKFLNSKKFYYIEFYPDLYATWREDDLKKLKKIFKNFASYYISLFEKNKKIFKNSLLDTTFVNEMEIDKMAQCGKIHISPKGEFYACDKVFSLPLKERKKYLVGNTQKGINNKKRLAILEKLREGFLKESGLNCQQCKYFKYCFCPLGHYIYFLSLKDKNKKMIARSLLGSFCCLSKIYGETFWQIKNSLKYHPQFVKLYQY